MLLRFYDLYLKYYSDPLFKRELDKNSKISTYVVVPTANICFEICSTQKMTIKSNESEYTDLNATACNFLFIAFSEEKFDSDNFLHLTQFFFHGLCMSTKVKFEYNIQIRNLRIGRKVSFILFLTFL